jgi:hypothetical protein
LKRLRYRQSKGFEEKFNSPRFRSESSNPANRGRFGVASKIRLLSDLWHEAIVAHARNVRLIGESRR